MVLSLGSNLTSDPSLRAMSRFSDQIGRSMQRIGSGRKINLSTDNPSGSGVSLNLSSQLRRYQAIKDGIANAAGLVQVQIGALSDIQRLLTRAEVIAINYKSPFRWQMETPKKKSSVTQNPNFGGAGAGDFGPVEGSDFGASTASLIIDNLEWSNISPSGTSSPTGVRSTIQGLLKSAFNGIKLFSESNTELLKVYTNLESSSFVNVSRPGLQDQIAQLRTLVEDIDDVSSTAFEGTVKNAKSEVEDVLTTKASDLRLLQDFVDQMAARTSSTERNLSRIQDTDLAAEAVYKTRSIIGYLASSAMQAQANVRRDMALKLIVS
jgi:flagellin-like hook-associated protein FlgL